MKKLAIIILLTVLPVMAQDSDIRSIGITFDIQPDLSVKQTTEITFMSAINGSFNYTVNENVRNIEISDANEYELLQAGNEYKLQILLKEPSEKLTIAYTVDKIIFKSDSINHFFTEFSFEKPVEKMSVDVKLPEGYGIYQNAYRPSDGIISSDGKRIILAWNDTNTLGAIFSVKFSSLNQEINIWLAVAIALGAAIVFLYAYFRKKAKKEFMTGFRTDEQKVIEFLEQHKTCLQSQLQHEFKFSRAKATRIVMKLEEKGLLRKQRYGRTNKLFWLK